jgi:hypothetical protein
MKRPLFSAESAAEAALFAAGCMCGAALVLLVVSGVGLWCLHLSC